MPSEPLTKRRAGVVLHRHHPRADRKLDVLRDRQARRRERERAFDLRLEPHASAAERGEAALVVALRGGAGRGEKQRRDAVAMRPDAAPVERLERRLDVVARPDGAEHLDEVLLLLAPHPVEGHGPHRQVGERMGVEGERAGIAERFQHRPVVGRDHRRKLQEIADHDDLDAAEPALVGAQLAQPRIHGVDEIGAHHRHLVDDEPLHPAIDAAEAPGVGEVRRIEHVRLEAEEGMDGLRLGVERGDAGRRDGRLAFAAGPRLEILHEPRLAGAGAADDEERRHAGIDGGERLGDAG